MSGRYFPAGMHQAAVSNRSKPCGKRDFCVQNFCAQVALSESYGLARPESNGFKCTAILTQCNFAFGTAIEVIEHNSGQPTLSNAA
jgi:hypothetical protein